MAAGSLASSGCGKRQATGGGGGRRLRPPTAPPHSPRAHLEQPVDGGAALRGGDGGLQAAGEGGVGLSLPLAAQRLRPVRLVVRRALLLLRLAAVRVGRVVPPRRGGGGPRASRVAAPAAPPERLLARQKRSRVHPRPTQGQQPQGGPGARRRAQVTTISVPQTFAAAGPAGVWLRGAHTPRDPGAARSRRRRG